MARITALMSCLALLINLGFGQARSASFYYYTNPVIPGDHADCTLTKVGNDYYTTGSSFNPTPVIYHTTDLVHWEAIAQPVSAAWSGYGDNPAGGCWGGQVVYYSGKWWDFFSHNFQMYFVTADSIRGSWTLPTLMNTPSGVPGLGYDNSIFIDDDGSWYLLVKNGQVNNWIVQLGTNGQPSGAIYNLCWINPSPSYPFSWAEGPVMWKHNGYYYYSFARNVAGGQYVFRSNALTDSQSAWVNLGNFFNVSDPLASTAVFQNPNHSSAAVAIDNGTSWVIHPLWRNANNNEWYGQGRQGLLNQVTYDAGGRPTADYPVNTPKFAPLAPTSGIPWMVPHADFFTSTKLNPEWSFLGYTAANTHSLTTRPGWLTLSPRAKDTNTVVKNDGEHNYSLITRVHSHPQTASDQAGLWIINGLQTITAKLYCTAESGTGKRIVAFGYEGIVSTVNSPAETGNDTLLLKLVRNEHVLTGYCSTDGYTWVKVGPDFTVADMDGFQPNYNAWTGNRQGLFVQGSSADFDFYIYRDAYTPIAAECPANQYGTNASVGSGTGTLEVHTGDWALYAGVEFGRPEYPKQPDSVFINASCASTGGTVEVWLDSLDTGTRIATCSINNTGSWSAFRTFGTNVQSPVAGNHDVYLKFIGTSSDSLFVLQSLVFTAIAGPATSARDVGDIQSPCRFNLQQNYPNPFNPSTQIAYSVPQRGYVSLKVYDLLGREVTTLFDGLQLAGDHIVTFDAGNFASGVYFYTLAEGMNKSTRKLLLMK